jgi:hypothetical protein
MRINRAQWGAAFVACTMMIVSPVASAAPANTDRIDAATTMDVALGEGGLLVGQVMDRQGVAQADSEVVVFAGDRVVVRTTTDENGVFAAAGMRGGTYQVATRQGASSIRAWAPDTAPPSAREGSLIIVGDEVVRGQITDSPRWVWEWCKQHPWLCTIGALTAVAVPLAIAADDDTRS